MEIQKKKKKIYVELKLIKTHKNIGKNLKEIIK